VAHQHPFGTLMAMLAHATHAVRPRIRCVPGGGSVHSIAIPAAHSGQS
jgi:hypothetical protein